MSWLDDAACHGMDTEDFFGPYDIQQHLALKVCAKCPVLDQCAKEAARTPYGLLGGIPEGSPGRPTAGNTRTPPKPKAPRLCTVEGCDRDYDANGLCDPHRGRLLRTGDVQAHIPIRSPSLVDEEDGFGTVAQVAREFGVDPSDMLGRSRMRHLVGPRQEAMCRLWDDGWSSAAIGRLFGRDHTTVLHAVNKLRRQVAA